MLILFVSKIANQITQPLVQQKLLNIWMNFRKMVDFVHKENHKITTHSISNTPNDPINCTGM